MPNTVAIIGCGPAGLLAAHAVVLRGGMPIIFSPGQKSMIHGAQYLHEAIPDLTSGDPDAMLTYRKIGTREGYAKKVYGRSDAPCSWDTFQEGEVPAWSLLAAYDDLWELYGHMGGNTPVGPAEMLAIKESFETIINTAPAPSFCGCGGFDVLKNQGVPPWRDGRHTFDHTTIRVVDWAPDELPDNTIEYNGEAHHDWYRHSKIFGHAQSEIPGAFIAERGWPYAEGGGDVHVTTVIPRKGIKPISNDCDCQEGIMQVGRFGKWDKGVLVSDAFREVYDALQ